MQVVFIVLSNEAFKVGKNSTKSWFAVNWSCEFAIVPTYCNVKKQYGVFKFSLENESDVLILIIQTLLELFYVTCRAKK